MTFQSAGENEWEDFPQFDPSVFTDPGQRKFIERLIHYLKKDTVSPDPAIQGDQIDTVEGELDTHVASTGVDHSDVVLNNAHRVSSGSADHSDIAANTAHVTANGSSHTFISQSVTSTASPTFVAVKVSGTQVVSTRKTGYTAMTGTANRGTSLATTTVTTEELARRVKAIQEDLTTHGLIGS